MVTKLAELGADPAAVALVSTASLIFTTRIRFFYIILRIIILLYSYQDGGTAIMSAAAGGHLALVMKLAELGVNPAAADNVSAFISIFASEKFLLFRFSFACFLTRVETLLS